MLVGGAESMCRAPWVLPKTEKPYPAGDMTAGVHHAGLASGEQGHDQGLDHLPRRGHRTAPRKVWRHTGGAGRVRRLLHNLSAAAWDEGFYDNLVAPVPGTDLVRDEGIRAGSSAEKLAGLKTVFRAEDGHGDGGERVAVVRRRLRGLGGQ